MSFITKLTDTGKIRAQQNIYLCCMIRKVPVSFLLILAVLLQAAASTFIVVRFEIRRNEIARTLCIMRADKNNKCHGSCQLRKQLATQEQEEKALNIDQCKFEATVSGSSSAVISPPVFSADSLDVVRYLEWPSGFLNGSFRPPCA